MHHAGIRKTSRTAASIVTAAAYHQRGIRRATPRINACAALRCRAAAAAEHREGASKNNIIALAATRRCSASSWHQRICASFLKRHQQNIGKSRGITAPWRAKISAHHHGMARTSVARQIKQRSASASASCAASGGGIAQHHQHSIAKRQHQT